MMGPEFDEENAIQEEIEARKDPYEGKVDAKDDKVSFEIAIINRRNEALCIDCASTNGQIYFNKVRVHEENGIQMSKNVNFNVDYSLTNYYKGPRFSTLSEPV